LRLVEWVWLRPMSYYLIEVNGFCLFCKSATRLRVIRARLNVWDV